MKRGSVFDPPRLLDLFCGAGGAARGYQLADFYVTGVDHVPQPRYCGEAFVQADALTYVAEHGREYDAIHASPPCQGYSIMRNLPWLRDREYPLLITPTRDALVATGKPWVLENVMGAHLPAGWLCGAMFGLPVYRHRAFETSFFWLQPGHPRHRQVIKPGRRLGHRRAVPVYSAAEDARGLASRPNRRGRVPVGFQTETGRHSLAAWQRGNGAQRPGVGVGHAAGWRDFARALGVEWMDREGATQAIPPAYTHYLGVELLAVLRQANGT